MDRPLKFCMITTFYPPYNFGGDGIFVHRLSNELARNGHEVDVIHCQESYRLLAGRHPKRTYADHPNVTVHGLKSRFGPLSPLATHQTGFPFFKRRQIQDVLEKDFDVIHYHNISLVGGPKVLSLGRAVKLYTLHEYWMLCPTHVLFKYKRSVCRKQNCLLCSLAYRRPPQCWRYSSLLKRAVEHVDSFIAPSRFVKEIHRQRGMEAPSIILPYFIPESTNALPVEHGRGGTDREPYFLFMGRLEKLKGLQTLISVFQNYPKFTLWIAGEGRDARWLKELAGGFKNIRFLGYQSGQKQHELYRRAIAVIVPSVCFDVSPQVILEAFRVKTPVIVRNLGGMPEMIVQSGGGYIYASEPQLLAAMEKLLTDPCRREAMGIKGHRGLKQHWTAAAHLQRYFSLIEHLR